ncbi:hypothetical protein BAE44_0004494 [Dichanthelium oligosanthes]|uniref:Uncharacterized protein n=1 Tax=Dichanthelium oligosanthes TaxID=888268 RepID=A0A1E5WAT0_9POAL|nr:hypothetical protein BAE44_0004494 [Dichanthelium oligosanthes]
MSRRTRQPVAASRRTRRVEQPQHPPAVALAESPKIVSNPIFRCEAGPSQQAKPPGDPLRCVYRPGSLYSLVHDPATASGAGNGIGKPLPLPPCRAHRAGAQAVSHVPASRSGPALVARGPHGRVLRRAPLPQDGQDPFLAAYVACTKGGAGGGKDAAEVDRPRRKQKQGKKKKRVTTKKKGKEIVRGCGIWSGWAAGAKYAGAMSCRHGCAVAEQQQGDAPATAAKAEEDAPSGPTLDLSWAPAVLSARAIERRREQR